MKKALFFVVLFYAFVPLSAQKLHVFSGQVIDSLTREPLAGANINVNFGDLVLNADKNGQFRMEFQERKKMAIVVKFVGYKPWHTQVDFTKNMHFDIALWMVSHDLEEVIVSSSAQTDRIKRPVLGINSISIKTLVKLPSALGELDILRGLQMLPGVTSVGEAANGVNIRGGSTDQNLLLLDDAPIFNPTHMFGLFSAFPSEAVSNFDLYKGTIPTRYGGRAAAVLDVTMVNPSLDKMRLSGGISFVSEHFKLETPIIKDKLAIMISGRAAFNDFLFPIISPELANIKAKFGDASVKIFYKLSSKSTLTYSGYFSTDFFQTQVLGTLNNINSTSTQYAYKTLNHTLNWFYAVNPNLNFQTKIISSNYNPATMLPEVNSDNKIKITSGIDYKQLKSNVNITKNNHKIEGGVDIIKYEIKPGQLNPGTDLTVKNILLATEHAIESGLYVEDEVEISKKITASAGLRYSYFINRGPATYRTYQSGMPLSDATVSAIIEVPNGKAMKAYGGFEPRSGLKYQLSAKQSFKIGYNLMRQYLQVITNTTTPLPTSRWKTADNYLKPQISSLYTAGYFQELNDNIYEYSIEAYYRNTKNIVDYKPGADFLLQQYPETQLLQGVNHSYGLEFMLSKKKGAMTGWANYTYSRSFNKVDEGPTSSEKVNFGNWYRANYDRPHMFNAAIVINQSKHHDFSFNFTYSTGRPFTMPQSFITYQDIPYAFYGSRNNARIQDYHRLDFSWNIYNPGMNEKKKWKGNWNFTVYNLYARKNAYSVFLTTENGSVVANKLTIFGVAIASLSYNFKLN